MTHPVALPSWRRWPPGYYLVLVATDLLGFESLAGKEGLELKHPAQRK